MISTQELHTLSPQMRQAVLSLMAEHDEQLRAKDALIVQRSTRPRSFARFHTNAHLRLKSF